MVLPQRALRECVQRRVGIDIMSAVNTKTEQERIVNWSRLLVGNSLRTVLWEWNWESVGIIEGLGKEVLYLR